MMQRISRLKLLILLEFASLKLFVAVCQGAEEKAKMMRTLRSMRHPTLYQKQHARSG
jgi:hypothetical protein